MESNERNVLGGELQCCCTAPMTGFYRDGFCRTGPIDAGRHVVCAVVTAEFLVYTKAMGNDLSTPIEAYGFPGLQPGDKWCLCAVRWQEAMEDGVAPLVDLAATHEKALEFVGIDVLQKYGVSV